jgi:hypothetical protein
MKKIAIICAPPHGEFNPGMHSVDLAAFSFFHRNNFSEEIDLQFYVLHDPEPRLKEFLFPQLPFKYQVFFNQLDELYQSDLIIYWGDFFHNAPFNRGLSRRLVHYGIAENENLAMEIIQKHFFLSEAPMEVLNKTVVFGSNYFINGAKDMLNETFKDNSVRFFSNIKRVWNRDMLSAIRMSHIKSDYTTNFLGVDCCFLFENGFKSAAQNNSNWAQTWLKSIINKKPKAGVFLGRMPKDLTLITPFVAELKQQLKVDMEWIPWFWQNEEFYTTIRQHLPGVLINQEFDDLMALYELLKSYDFIITDTYHLCLNAWKMGIPAICIGSGNSLLDGALTDKKKEFFFDMYEAQDFYVYLEEIKHVEARTNRIHLLAEYIFNQTITNKVTENIHRHKASVENQLYELITSIFDKRE